MKSKEARDKQKMSEYNDRKEERNGTVMRLANSAVYGNMYHEIWLVFL
jgi:hypothetical protein